VLCIKNIYNSYYRKYTMTDYKFVYFDNKDEEKEFVENNNDKIVEIATRCVSPGDEFDQIKENDAFRGVVQKSRSQWFFVTSDDHIVAFCKLTPKDSMTRFNQPLKTYEPFVYDDIDGIKVEKHITTGPFIDALCKTAGYKGAGVFLLDNMHRHLKSKGAKRVYIIPESMRTKEAYQVGQNCKLKDEYFKSNQKLVKYYEKMGYEIIENTYFVEECKDRSSESIAYNAMVYDLNKVLEGESSDNVENVNSDDNNRSHHQVRSRGLRRMAREMDIDPDDKRLSKLNRELGKSLKTKLMRRLSREYDWKHKFSFLYKNTPQYLLKYIKSEFSEYMTKLTAVMRLLEIIANTRAQNNDNIVRKVVDHYKKNQEFIEWSLRLRAAEMIDFNTLSGDMCEMTFEIKFGEKYGEKYLITGSRIAEGYKETDEYYIYIDKSKVKVSDMKDNSMLADLYAEDEKIVKALCLEFPEYYVDSDVFALMWMMIVGYLMDYKAYVVLGPFEDGGYLYIACTEITKL
jgi:hypothetical protein